MKKPELLVPAGNLDKLKIGLQYGADAFYLGLPTFSMRSGGQNFTEEELMEGVKLIRDAGKTLYITLNIFPRGLKVEAFKHHIEFLRDKVKPDAIILADPGVFEIVREVYPEVEVHISVQANVLNWRGVKFWQKQGVTRVILPRELMMKEIQVIHEKVSDMELEFFVHGAICVAYSGRCLISAYMTGRDANQGQCAHSCRWKYRLEEEKRPGEYMPIEEDEHGTHIMNSRDMCLLPYLKELMDAGICSFKIEGRNKTEHYLASVTKAYRKAIDDMVAGRDFDESLVDDVKKTANRGFIPGFLKGFPGEGNIYYEKNAPISTHKFIGIVREVLDNEMYRVEIRNRLEKGEEIEVMTPSDQFSMKIEEMFDMGNEPVDTVHGGAGDKVLRLKEGLPVGAILRDLVSE